MMRPVSMPVGRGAPVALAVMLLLPARADAQSNDDLRRMTLQQLMQVEVTTVSREPEPSGTTPAAVFVITQDDIRRSGATTLAEALRLAPGIQVARIDASRWAIGMRGFADRLARSMLVLMDGRAVYSPLFAGTYWEVQDTVLEDIDRIEVIAGPGGTLWGANAVNGIVNIITKPASDTQGVLVSAGAGSIDAGVGVVRYGGAVGAHGHARAYFKAADRRNEHDVSGGDYDTSHLFQSGFRGDWNPGGRGAWTLQGDVYGERLAQRAVSTSYAPPFSAVSRRDSPLAGGNVLARWSGRPGTGGDVQIQAYYDRTYRDERPVRETRDTADVDFQQRQPEWKRQALVWGAGYRVTSGRITAFETTSFSPPSRTDSLFSAFAQDDFTLVPLRLHAIGGVKMEHNDYSGFEVQPSARLLWTIDRDNTFVASVTRAVRTPSRVETDYTTTSVASPVVPAFVRLLPDPDFHPEELTAYELVFRTRPAARAYVTVSGFFNHLDDLLSTELATPLVESDSQSTRLILPVSFMNGLHGNSQGVELTGDVRPTSWWRTTVHYSYLQIRIARDPLSRDVSQERRYEGLSPNHQVQIQTGIDLPRAVAVDWTWRYVSDLAVGPVPDYATSNLRVSWQPRRGVELAIVGKDLQDDHHLEWPADGGTGIEISRSVFASVTLRR
jgi:iron complex outermembrane receptor protein